MLNSDSFFPSSPTPESLESLKEEFAVWRHSRTKRGKIPDFLWKRIHHLTKTYGNSRIARELGLNKGNMVNQLTKRFTSLPTEHPVNFVEVPFESMPVSVDQAPSSSSTSSASASASSSSPSVPLPQSPTTLEVKRIDGTILFFNHLQSDHLTTVIDRLVGR